MKKQCEVYDTGLRLSSRLVDLDTKVWLNPSKIREGTLSNKWKSLDRKRI